MINISKLTQRLKEFESGQNSKYLWKPKEGSQTIRIIPYRYEPENPFMELKFYYKLGGKSYLAPCTFGKPDPVMELVDSLRASGSQEDRELAKKIAPVTRTYCPVIVRPSPGNTRSSFAFWGFGVQVYKQLLEFITDPEWSNLLSLTDGHDITVKFLKESGKKGPSGTPLPETKIAPSPKQSPAVDKSDTELMEMAKNQINILDIFPLPTYDDLKQALETMLEPEGNTPPEVQEPDAIPDHAKVTPAQTSVTEANAPKAPTEKKDVAKQFDSFFAQ